MDATGDPAFLEFVRSRSAALLRSAYLLTGDRHLAEDLVQTALAKTALRWKRIDQRNAEAYTRRVLYHEQVDGWRRKRVAEAFPGDLPDRAAVRVGERAHRPEAGRPAGALAARSTAARRGRAAVLRGPDRARDRRDPRVLDRHREEPGTPRAGHAARGRARPARHELERQRSADQMTRQLHDVLNDIASDVPSTDLVAGVAARATRIRWMRRAAIGGTALGVAAVVGLVTSACRPGSSRRHPDRRGPGDPADGPGRWPR